MFGDRLSPTELVLPSAEIRRQEAAETIAQALVKLRPGDRLEVEAHDGRAGDGRLFTVTVSTPDAA